MTLLLPWALLLALPLALLVWRLGSLPPPAGALRWALVGMLPLALAQPVWHRGGDAMDLVVVVDRSRSMPRDADSQAEELLRLAEQKRAPGQRVGVVTFGREARIERPPQESAVFAGFSRSIDAEASDLAQALGAAEELLPSDRAGRVLVLSDGKATGGDVKAAARRLALRGIPVDFRVIARAQGERDVAVKELEVPPTVFRDEPFHLSAVVTASAPATVRYTLTRGGSPVARGEAELKPGDNRLLFRDRVPKEGLADYRLVLEGAGDALPENDRGRAVVRVAGPPRVLVLRTSGSGGAIASALAADGLTVDVAAPPLASLDPLDGVKAVVVENVPAEALGETGMRVLDLFVRERGGGLLMTGGPKSFGQGGYHKSALDPLLPVSMELRQEQRKNALAMVIAMDRSGSMSVQTASGRTKMSLAAEGAVAALQLLGPGDEAAVWVVDEKAHEIVGLQPVDKGLPMDKVAAIQSEGGGIFIYEALEAAALEIDQSDKKVRHIVLFADAADSENPGDYKSLVADLRKKDITVSVIGMGTPADSDAHLLMDIAALGGGRMYFADNPYSLPRLFAEETLLVARASYVDEPTALSLAGDLAQLGPPEPELLKPPRIAGYNMTYLRPTAGAAYRTADENKAPLLAMWQQGLGRVAALTTLADGPGAANLLGWKGYAPLVTKTVRWAMGPADSSDALVKVRREGHELVVTAEVLPGEEALYAGGSVALLPGNAEGPVRTEPLRQEGDGRLTARFALTASGTFHPVVKLGGRVLEGAPATLPYAPEFEPSPPGRGRELLEAIAAITSGRERLSVDGLFDKGEQRQGGLPLAPLLTALALVAMLSEVFLRRFYFRARAVAVSVPATRPAAAGATFAPPSNDVPPEAAPAKTVESALEAARARAKKRLGK